MGKATLRSCRCARIDSGGGRSEIRPRLAASRSGSSSMPAVPALPSSLRVWSRRSCQRLYLPRRLASIEGDDVCESGDERRRCCRWQGIRGILVTKERRIGACGLNAAVETGSSSQMSMTLQLLLSFSCKAVDAVGDFGSRETLGCKI